MAENLWGNTITDAMALHEARVKAVRDEKVDRVAWAINAAWTSFGEVPFPLYQHEAEKLAVAAIEALERKD